MPEFYILSEKIDGSDYKTVTIVGKIFSGSIHECRAKIKEYHLIGKLLWQSTIKDNKCLINYEKYIARYTIQKA